LGNREAIQQICRIGQDNDMTKPDDEEIERQVKAIHGAVRACRQALSDLLIEEKFLALDQLRGWLELEKASHLPEAAKDRQH
jgi:hypothetical protein